MLNGVLLAAFGLVLRETTAAPHAEHRKGHECGAGGAVPAGGCSLHPASGEQDGAAVRDDGYWCCVLPPVLHGPRLPVLPQTCELLPGIAGVWWFAHRRWWEREDPQLIEEGSFQTLFLFVWVYSLGSAWGLASKWASI